MKVSAPDGEVYRVRRRWLPWRWRRRISGKPWDLDVADGLDFVDGIPALLFSIVLALFVVFVLPIVVLVLLSGVEWFLLIAVLPFAVAGRVLFGRHWTVEVRRGRRLVREEPGGTWTQSGKQIVGLAAEIRSGHLAADVLSAP